MAEPFSLKDLLFNKAKVEQIAGEISRAYPSFRKSVFVRETTGRFPELELKQRITWIADCLKKNLPGDYAESLDILLKALPPPNNPKLADNDFGDFIYAPYGEFVARYGCTKKHLNKSLHALREITKRFSAEDAIRYFINEFPRETLKALNTWTSDSNYHVRRLCSEGTRPKLPWSKKVNIADADAIPVLDKLFCDRTRYVTRSVANHINDISKVNPALAMNTLVRWKKSGKQVAGEMNYIIRHGLRSLVKAGNERAMEMLGFAPSLPVSVTKFTVPPRVMMNTVLEFSLLISTAVNANLVVDYIIYFRNKAGLLNSKKVFKLTQLSAVANIESPVSKRHMLREYMTTRTLYAGKHEIAIQVNGKEVAKRSFLLG